MNLPLPGVAPVVSVTELNARVRALLENQFETLWVAGELSNVKHHAASGHWYFCLKDPGAQIGCAMFRTRARFLDFRPENGLKVEVRARVTIYEPRGDYQLVVEEIRKAGLGALYEAFERLKAKLEAEGLFARQKRLLPPFPRAIGIVTSPAAAALRDVLTTLAKRAPMIPVVLYPAPVQGEGAGEMLARAIRTASARAECDVIILCRGGGSLEDLWAFNEEALARAIAASRVPVVSGVGHETDFSIADFAADLRAPTPTAAATAASPDRAALAERVALQRRRLTRDLNRILERAAQRLDLAARGLLTPAQRLERNREHIAQHARRLRLAMAAMLQRDRRAVASLAAGLTHLDPTRVLGRGYSIVRDASGHVRLTSAGLAAGDTLQIQFSEGAAQAAVTRVGSDSE